MSYREPANKKPPVDMRELDEYEERLRRTSRRRKIFAGLFIGGMGVVGMGSCMAPCATAIGSEMWDGRKTKLTSAEAKEVDEALSRVETETKKSQETFAAIWPKVRAGEIGPRADLGRCKVDISGPVVERKDDNSVSLSDSSEGSGWIFVDLTPDARSPIAKLEMPRGSIPLNNTGTGERFVLPSQALHVAPANEVPTLSSSERGKRIAELRAEAGGAIRHDRHARFVEEAKSLAKERTPIDVIVFVDLWQDPKFNAEARTKDEKLADLEEAARTGRRPARSFEGGLAIARAFAWSSREQRLVCASQALAQSSPDITFRSDDLAPLQRDLVLQLEKSLERSFVAAGDKPPRLEPPPRPR